MVFRKPWYELYFFISITNKAKLCSESARFLFSWTENMCVKVIFMVHQDAFCTFQCICWRHVSIVFWLAIFYKNHVCDICEVNIFQSQIFSCFLVQKCHFNIQKCFNSKEQSYVFLTITIIKKTNKLSDLQMKLNRVILCQVINNLYQNKYIISFFGLQNCFNIDQFI